MIQFHFNYISEHYLKIRSYNYFQFKFQFVLSNIFKNSIILKDRITVEYSETSLQVEYAQRIFLGHSVQYLYF